MPNPEHYRANKEHTGEIGRVAAERSVELLEEQERSLEGRPETAEEELKEARKNVERLAKSKETEVPTASSEKIEYRAPKHLSREDSYKHTIKDVQRQISAPERLFSKFIHNKQIEAASEVVGSTVARPNAILSGAICAFIVVLALYITARYMGFYLSGFETIGAFILGWIIGTLIDALRALFK